MVTPDKDFGQLVDQNVFVYKPGRMGDAAEVLGLPEIQKRWSVQRALSLSQRNAETFRVWGVVEFYGKQRAKAVERLRVRRSTVFNQEQELRRREHDLKRILDRILKTRPTLLRLFEDSEQRRRFPVGERPPECA